MNLHFKYNYKKPTKYLNLYMDKNMFSFKKLKNVEYLVVGKDTYDKLKSWCYTSGLCEVYE